MLVHGYLETKHDLPSVKLYLVAGIRDRSSRSIMDAAAAARLYNTCLR